jgi:hypothetical protein
VSPRIAVAESNAVPTVLYSADPKAIDRARWFTAVGVVLSLGIGVNFTWSLATFHQKTETGKHAGRAEPFADASREGETEYAQLPLRIFGGVCGLVGTVGCAAAVWSARIALPYVPGLPG